MNIHLTAPEWLVTCILILWLVSVGIKARLIYWTKRLEKSQRQLLEMNEES